MPIAHESHEAHKAYISVGIYKYEKIVSIRINRSKEAVIYRDIMLRYT